MPEESRYSAGNAVASVIYIILSVLYIIGMPALVFSIGAVTLYFNRLKGFQGFVAIFTCVDIVVSAYSILGIVFLIFGIVNDIKSLVLFAGNKPNAKKYDDIGYYQKGKRQFLIFAGIPTAMWVILLTAMAIGAM